MATLYKAPAMQPIDENKISVVDKRICSYIEKYGNISYDTVIAEDSEWQVFYNLSELRTALVSWYDFKPNANVLEIGAGFGALTGRLCKLCGHVTATERSLYRAEVLVKRYNNIENLDVCAGDVFDMEFGKEFDYIIVTGLLERVGNGTSSQGPYVKYIEDLKRFLKSDGKMLLAVENRYGLRYFCGATEPHTNHAFDGINRYRRGASGYSFSRQELDEILQNAGFIQRKFYYPLPDYKLPQLIYTDEYLPEPNLKERLIPYYQRNDTLIASEAELYDDIVANGVFPFFANSFLVECSVHGPMGNVLYAAVSTDRGEHRSFATVIGKDGLVRKKPLYEWGTSAATGLYENIKDLEQHGIPVVQHVLNSDGSLELPYVPWPTLSNYIKTVMERYPERVVALVDRLYDYILQSSEQVAAEENALGTGELDFGPILAKAYMELIPLNCFYNPKTDEFLYFDQEFVREKYPAKYVLFRAIHYIYCFTPGAEQAYPLQKMIERYGMQDTWQTYLAEENRFLDEVRSREKYKQFYRWTRVDYKRMLENSIRLESEEELIANYKVPHKMKQIWKAELDILDEIDRICKKNDLRYFFVHGSLLGAVRHKGFIPWDDDVDVAMLREDYDRFLEVAPEELSAPLSIHTPRTEKDIFWGGYARIRNCDTTAIEARDLGHKGNLGIWVDILPLDACTMDEGKIAKKEREICKYQRLLLAKIYGADFKEYADMGAWKWRLYQYWSRFYSHSALCVLLDKAQRMFASEEKEWVAFFTGYGKHRPLRAADFADVTLLEFEGRMVPAPKGYKNYLFASMGKDYMKYPPEDERKPKHRGIFDPEKPYEQYTELLCNTFADVKGKKIILFGAGLMFEDYMKKYGDKYRPDFLVDNDENKWGRFKMGVEICSPQTILAVPAAKRHLIICSYYYREISSQLEEMGVHNYKVYVQETDWILQTENNRKDR